MPKKHVQNETKYSREAQEEIKRLIVIIRALFKHTVIPADFLLLERAPKIKAARIPIIPTTTKSSTGEKAARDLVAGVSTEF